MGLFSEMMDEAGDLKSEVARLRKGIQDYLDGNYEHPRKHRPDLGECKHGMPWYSECACCDCDHFQRLLDGPSHSNGVLGPGENK